ncbi:MAG TPA: HEAT repeat domain-containing protein [Pirellulales bacterium]|jgi:HEAT repeat protein|nr:HEAT repeat domain-containing protein [Pirellulales bacterium]
MSESQSPQSAPRFSPDNALPPVEPPSATFILQLFLIPAAIVAIIVCVWLAFNWLAQRGSDPYDYLQALERDSAVRWQAAVNLADALRDARHADLKHNRAVIQRLVAITDREIDAGLTDEDSLKLRVYLCNALGEFAEPEAVLPVLLKAASTQRHESERFVRFAAIKAIAVLLNSSPDFDRRGHREVLDVLLKASDDPEPVIRSTAAFALGAYGGDEAQQRLERLLNDAYPDVRYNAATTLARLGNAAAVPVLVEMLDPKSSAGIAAEEEEGAREYKQTTIYVNALRAAGDLAQSAQAEQFDTLREAIERLRACHPTGAVDVQARDALRALDGRK